MKQNMASRREREKERGEVRAGQGLKGGGAGYETKKCGELRVRWRGLCALGEMVQNTGVPRRALQTEHGRYKTEKERESEGWARIMRF